MTIGLMLIKGMVLLALGKIFGLNRLDQKLFALALAQAGEFGFVLLAFVVQNAVMPAEIADRLLLVVALSMLLTPLLFIFYDKVIVPRAYEGEGREQDVIEEENPVIIAGHGRFGQMVNSLLLDCGFKTTVIDYDADTVEGMSKFGIKTYFGDASRPELLETAGVMRAKLFVVAIDNREQAVTIVKHLRHIRPDMPIVVRSYDRLHTYELYQAGAENIVRETFDAAVRAGRLAIEVLGVDKEKSQEVTDLFYHRDRHSVARMASAYDPELPRFGNTKMAAIARDVDAETSLMIQALLRGEKVDWNPGIENQQHNNDGNADDDSDRPNIDDIASTKP